MSGWSATMSFGAGLSRRFSRAARMSSSRIAVVVVVILVFACNVRDHNATQVPGVGARNTTAVEDHPDGRWSRIPSAPSDDYVEEQRKWCARTRSLLACVKYKATKSIWRLVTNGYGFFPSEYGRTTMWTNVDERFLSVIQLGEPSDVAVFADTRNAKDDRELTKVLKFLKRALDFFGRNHGVQITLSSDSGARVASTDVGTNRLGHKKKKKWLIILPLIILMKIAHLKMTIVTLLFGVLGLNMVLIGGIGWLIHYLKFKTLCKIHPQLVQSHSHVYDSDPAEYSQFIGSSFPSSYYSSSRYGPHEVGYNSHAKSWPQQPFKGYSGGYNYLDTVSKRLE